MFEYEYASGDATQKFHYIIDLRPQHAPLPHSILQFVVEKSEIKTKQNKTHNRK